MKNFKLSYLERLYPNESVDPRVSEEEVLRMVQEAHLSYKSLWKIKSFLCRKNLGESYW